jgi:hypothetical protein
MHLLHLLCPREQVFSLAQEFEARFESQETPSVAASGLVLNQPVGFVVLTSQTPFDEELLTEINHRPDISGYSLFTLNDDDVFGPFGSELVISW